METQEGRTKFRQADALFRQGQFGDALKLLDELDAAFPNNKQVLYPRALCLEKLGRYDEAEAVCRVLAQQLKDPRAAALQAQIETSRAAAGGEIGLGAFADLLEPAVKPPAPVIVQEPAWRRHAVIGVVIVAVAAVVVLGYVAYQKGWLPSRPKTAEDIVADLVAFWGKPQAFTADLRVSGQTAPAGMSIGINSSARTEYMTKDDKALFRLEGTLSMTGVPIPGNATVLCVSDGTTIYAQMGIIGQQMVMKFSMPTRSAAQPNLGKSVFEGLQKEFNMQRLPDEALDGVDAYVIELAPKPQTETEQVASTMGADFETLKMYITKDYRSQMRLIMLDAAGAPQFTISMANIVPNPTLNPGRFVFTPAPGVRVIDMSDPSGFMGMMRGLGGLMPPRP